MREGNLYRPMWKLFAIVLFSAATFILTSPIEATPPTQNCPSDFNSCIAPCTDPTTHITDPSCLNSCVQQEANCLQLGNSEAGSQTDCDGVMSTCKTMADASGIPGPEVGDCYDTYVSCSTKSYRQHFMPLQQVEIDPDQDCIDEEYALLQACLAGEVYDCTVNDPTGNLTHKCCYDIRKAHVNYCRRFQ